MNSCDGKKTNAITSTSTHNSGFNKYLIRSNYSCRGPSKSSNHSNYTLPPNSEFSTKSKIVNKSECKSIKTEIQTRYQKTMLIKQTEEYSFFKGVEKWTKEKLLIQEFKYNYVQIHPFVESQISQYVSLMEDVNKFQNNPLFLDIVDFGIFDNRLVILYEDAEIFEVQKCLRKRNMEFIRKMEFLLATMLNEVNSFGCSIILLRDDYFFKGTDGQLKFGNLAYVSQHYKSLTKGLYKKIIYSLNKKDVRSYNNVIQQKTIDPKTDCLTLGLFLWTCWSSYLRDSRKMAQFQLTDQEKS